MQVHIGCTTEDIVVQIISNNYYDTLYTLVSEGLLVAIPNGTHAIHKGMTTLSTPIELL